MARKPDRLDDLFLAGLSHLRTASVWGGNPFDFFYLNPIRLFFSPIKRLEARFHRRIQPSSWLLLVFSTWGYMGQGVAGFCPTGGWGMISIWVTQAAP